MKNFADQLIEAVKKKGNAICVGLDPRLDQIPKFNVENHIKEGGSPTEIAARSILEFNKGIIDAVADIVPVCKPQVAFYEIFGADGMRAYEHTLKYAKEKGLVTIADVKRNDIGSTAAAYARAYLGEMELFEGEDEVVMPIFDADSVTINPYLGWDGIKPFVEEARKYKKGLFVLVKTSNPSSGDLQDLELKEGGSIYEVVGNLVDSWGGEDIGESGYSFVGAVVGATYPQQAKELRRMMPNSIFLVPGYGAQGGGAEDVKPCFNKDGLGAIVNSSRGIIFAYEKLEGFAPEAFADAARQACEEMRDDLASIF
ncbi:orotidine-5'-phosphate decarboxylase [Candidatus Gracilibacteria bacterium]|nr:orotidine-5'-phosphate decarboxylase [Candidatus Gracilibacteria bacterium]